jgi:hypothetical protein
MYKENVWPHPATVDWILANEVAQWASVPSASERQELDMDVFSITKDS